MAYGIRYKLSWCAPGGIPLRHEILKNGYSGSVHEVEGSGNPFTLRKLNDKGKKGTIITTEASIEIYEDAVFNVDDIYTTDEREYQVKFYKNNVLDWVGYLLPDYFSKEIGCDQVVVLSAVDQLGSLKDKPFQNTNGTPYTGRTNLFDVINKCIQRTGIDLPFKDILNISSPNWTPVGGRDLDVLNDTFVDLTRFYDNKGNYISCYDVLETTLNLLNARIFIQGGNWWITNKRQVELKSGFVSTRNSSGVVTSKVALSGSNVSFDFIHMGGTQLIDGADNATTIFSEHGNFLEQIQNQLFLDRSGDNYSNWTKHNSYNFKSNATEPVKYSNDGLGIVTESSPLDPQKPRIISPSPVGTINTAMFYETSGYIESDPILIKPSYGIDTMRISLALRGYRGSSLLVMVTGRLVSNPSDLYLVNRNGDWGKETNNKRTLRYIPFTLPIPENTEGESMGGYLNAVEHSDIYLNINKFSSAFGLDAISEDYEVTVRLYGVMTPSISPLAAFETILKRVSLDFISANSPKGIIYSMLNNRDFTKKTNAINTLFSDKVTQGRNSEDFIAVGRDLNSTIFNRAGELTENWNSPVTTGNDFINMIVARQVQASYAIPQKILDVTLDEINIDFNRVYKPNSVSELYMVNSISTYYKAGGVSGYSVVEFAQVLNVPESSTPKISTTMDDMKGSGIKGIGSISGGSGGVGGSQDLQGVTDIGAETTNIISAKGLRALELLTIPVIASAEAGAIWIGDGTGGTITPSGEAVWGGITGNILNQTDLINYINAHGGSAYTAGSGISIVGNIISSNDTLQSVLSRGNTTSILPNFNGGIRVSPYIQFTAAAGEDGFLSVPSGARELRWTNWNFDDPNWGITGFRTGNIYAERAVVERGVQLSSRVGGGNINISPNNFYTFQYNGAMGIEGLYLEDPFGGFSATRLTVNALNGFISKEFSLKKNFNYVVSIYVKRVTASNVVISAHDNVSWASYPEQAVSTSTSWQRLVMSVKTNATGVIMVFIGQNNIHLGVQQGLGTFDVYGFKVEEWEVTPLVPSIQDMNLQQVADYGKDVAEINVKRRLTIPLQQPPSPQAGDIWIA